MNRLLLLAFLLTGLAGYTQKNALTRLAPSQNCRTAIIALVSEKVGLPTRLPFSSIEVRDIRPDTTKLGFYRSTKNFRHYKYAVEEGVQQHIEQYLNTHFRKNMDAGSPDKLVIYIKKLWLSAFDSTELNTHQHHLKDAWLYVKSDIYLQSGETMQPVYRYDSVLYARKKNNYTSSGFLTSALLESVAQLSYTDYDVVKRKRRFSVQEIDGFNKANMNNAALNQPVRGVYLSFEDFKNNRPSYSNFECKFESLADVVYVKDKDDQLYPLKNIWGFSNGEQVFIRMGSNFFPLYSQQNTWEFYGTASMEAKSPRMPVILGAGLPVAVASATAAEFANYEKKLIHMRAFQVDIENGRFY